ncbi:MAG: hypothetical protein AAF601_10570 [Pseudomonadota bacterium]
MRLIFAMFLALTAAPALADNHTPTPGGNIYSYKTHTNFCPAGLQPVTMDGVICCGVPNQSMSYQHVMAHASNRAHAQRAARVDCPVGAKGCNFN